MNDYNKKEIGERIKVIRKNMGLTMKEFGEKFNPPASDSIVSRWERGVSSPNNERLKLISEIGNVSMYYLLTGKKFITDLSKVDAMNITKNNDATKEVYETFKTDVVREIEELLESDLNFNDLILLFYSTIYLKSSSDLDILELTKIIGVLNQYRHAPPANIFSEEDIEDMIETEIQSFGNLLRRRMSYEKNN